MTDRKTAFNAFHLIIFFGFLFLLGRLIQLQLIFGKINRMKADGNRIKSERLIAPRGMIYDRDGRELVRNYPVYYISKEKERAAVEWERIDRDKALVMEVAGAPEAVSKVSIGREYLYGEALGQLLGYLEEAGVEDVASGKYRLGEIVGMAGIEKRYNETLRGKDGGKLFEVDSLGKSLRDIGANEPVPGKDIKLTIDAHLSKVAYDALEGKEGAIVVTKAGTGEILALVSSPSYDPEAFGIGSENKKDLAVKYLKDGRKPFFNRAIGGAYPPGSTFKIVTASAGLETGKITANTFYTDTGSICINEYCYGNWYFSQYGRTEGSVNVVTALKRSTDTFFYKVGEWVGADELAKWANKYGFGKKTGIDIEGEVAGLVPDSQWKLKTKGERWFLGNSYHYAIGQGDVLATPLQVNLMTGVVANGGLLCSPVILGKTNTPGVGLPARRSLGEVGGSPEVSNAGKCHPIGLQKETIEIIKEGMKEACSPGGTAYPFFDYRPQVVCKTGTAEISTDGKTHAWFTAFSPAENPEVVVTVLVEGGGEGSKVAAPIARKIFEAWFSNHLPGGH